MRHVIVGSLLIAGCIVFHTPASATDARGPCKEDVGRDFQAAPQQAGALAPALLKANETLDTGKYDIRSLLVLRDCKILFERYRSDINRDYNHTLYSATKSYAATLVGALLHSGRLKTIDVPIADLLPKPAKVLDRAWTENSRVTLRNVMQMTSGFDFRQAVGSSPIYQLKVDRFEVALNTTMIAAPGTKFNYSDADASVTGAMIAAVSGKDLYSTGKELLFEPMQMVNHDWWFVDAAGRYPGGWGLRLRPMDMAKLGQLYLQDCAWNGRAVCDAAYVKEAWTPGASQSYGLHWWIGRTDEGVNYFYANGVKGQRIIVLPSHGIVGVMTAILPVAEVRAVDTLLLTALTSVPADDASSADPAILAQLAALETRGFKGETRGLYLQEQDYPSAPR